MIPTFGEVWPKLQRVQLHVFDGFGVKSQDTEVVNGIAVDRVCIDLLVIVEDNVAPERTSPDDVSVRQDVSVAMQPSALCFSFSHTVGGEGCSLTPSEHPPQNQ